MNEERHFRCEFCSFEFDEEEARGACSSCPISSCDKLRCPNCGYEHLPEPGLVKVIKKWSRGRKKRKTKIPKQR